MKNQLIFDSFVQGDDVSCNYSLITLAELHDKQLDFQEGFKWNELVHRKPGAVDWPNPGMETLAANTRAIAAAIKDPPTLKKLSA